MTSNYPTILFCDLDNTLIHNHFLANGEYIKIQYGRGKASYLNKKVISILQNIYDLGVIVILITGRRLENYLPVSNHLPHSLGVIEHGGGIVSAGCDEKLTQGWEERHKETISDTKLKSGVLWEYKVLLEKQGFSIGDHGRKYSFRVECINSYVDTEKLLETISNDIKSNELGSKLTAVINNKHVDVIPCTSGKFNAARYIINQKGVKNDMVYSIGDDYNDIELLEYTKYSYCPRNSHPKLLNMMKKKGGFISSYESSKSAIDILTNIYKKIS